MLVYGEKERMEGIELLQQEQIESAAIYLPQSWISSSLFSGVMVNSEKVFTVPKASALHMW